MSDLVFVLVILVTGGVLMVGLQLLVWGVVGYRGDQELRRLQLQLMDAWRQSMSEWREYSQRSHEENMAFHKDASVDLRALLDRSNRD